MPIKRKPSLRWGIFFTIRTANTCGDEVISNQHTLCTLCIMVAGRIQNLDLYMSKIHVRNDNYMFDFIITAVLVLFPADNHGSPDPLRDSPERFPLGTSQASPGPINLRIYALLSHSHELRSGGKGSGRLLFQSLFQMCTSRKRRIWENRFSTGKMGIQGPKSAKRSLELLHS